MDETAGETNQPLDLSRCLNEAIDVWKQNWLVLALAAFLVTSLSAVTALILAGPLCGGLAILTLEALRREDKKVVIGDLFRDFNLVNVADRFLPLIGLFVLTTAAVVVGLCVLIVPGLILMTIWLYCYCLMVDKNLPVFAALRVSRDVVTYKGFWTNFLLVLIGVAIEFGALAIPSYVGVVISWFIGPIASLMIASAYIQLVDEDSGLVHNLIQAEQACTHVGL